MKYFYWWINQPIILHQMKEKVKNQIEKDFVENSDQPNKKWSIQELKGMKKEIESRLEFLTNQINEFNEEIQGMKEQPAPKAPSQNEFWNFIESYFVPIQDKLHLLQPKPMKPENIYEIGPLGVHYSEQWNQEDFKDENLYDNSTSINLERSAETLENYSLTQRLLCCFLEEKENTYQDDQIQEIIVQQKDYSSHAIQTFEEKVLKELRGLGIIQDIPTKQDEITVQMKELQDKLREIHHKNEEKRAEILKRVKENLNQEKKIQKRWTELKQLEKEYSKKKKVKL